MSIHYVAVYVLGHQSGLPGAPRWLTPWGEAGNTHGKSQDGKSFSADETRGESVARIVLTNGLAFDDFLFEIRMRYESILDTMVG